MSGAGTLTLQMELTARDLTGAALKSAEQRTKQYTSSSKKEFKDLLASAASYRKLVGSILAAKVLSRGMAALEQGIRDVVVNIVDMDQALTAASAKFGPAVYRGTENFKQMEQVVQGIAATTEYTASETAKGLDFLAMAGFDYAQSIKALPALTDLATASQTDFARASDIASDALGAFNMSTAPEDIERNLNRVNDVFSRTVSTSNTTMETLFDTMKMAGPVVEGGVEMFGTLAGTLGSAGIKGTVAATTLKNMFIRLQAPPSEAAKALRKLRVEIDDGSGNMDSMINIIGKLNNAFEGMGEIKRKAYLKDIFGQRAIAGANILLLKGKDALQDYFEVLDNSTGAAKEMADVMRSGLGTQLKVLQSTLMAKGFDIFKGLMGGKDPAVAVKELIEVVRQFDVGPIVQGLRDIGSMAKSTAEFLWEHREAIMTIAKVWAAASLTRKLTGFTSILADVAGGMSGLGASTVSATGSMAELGKGTNKLSMFLGGISPVVTTLVASLTLGYELWKQLQGMEEKKIKYENRLVAASMGETVTGEFLPIKEAKAIMGELEAKWKATEYDRRSLGEEGLSLTGETKSRSREDKMLQDTAEGLARYIAKREASFRRGYFIREKMFSGEWDANQPDSSADYWQGQGFGKSSWVSWEEQGKNVSGQSVVPPQIVWNPEQEFKVNVTVNGIPDSATATATVEKIPQVAEEKLGVPNG